jgi:hypothetical protein
MPIFAIYRKSKRRNDLVLVLWPITASDRLSAERIAAASLVESHESPKRLHAIEYAAPVCPPLRVRHFVALEHRALHAINAINEEMWKALYQNAPAVREPPP